MTIRVSLQHRTSYTYDRLVEVFPQVIRLRPAPHTRTPITAYSLRVSPEPHFLNWQQDPFGNFLARVVFPKKVKEFHVEVGLVAEMTIINPFDFFVETYAEKYPFDYDESLKKELLPYLELAPCGDLVDEYLKHVDRTPRPIVSFLVDINRKLKEDINYIIRLEPGVQTPEETLAKRSGSCRDSAWLLIQLFRRLGLAARFCSGYLIQLTPDVKPLDGPAGAESDFTDLHAWCEVFIPGAGWIGLDPTSGLLCGEGHIPLAATPSFASAAPISGAVEKCESTFDFSMSVTRIHEDPRVTKPYTAEQWNAILATGELVEEKLVQNDVRLTMGGEPTFVSIDDMDGPEWNTEALGATKRKLSDQLLKRLKDRFAKGALLHYGQGKWYPGESLPRWSFACYWRKDGEPIWNDPSLFADQSESDDADEKTAERFAQALAERLGVGSRWCIRGYEDAWYYMWRERRLPVNVDPLQSELNNREERARLARVFEQGLNKVVGIALPLRRSGFGADRHWESGPWFVRPEHLYLIPGDSPMGFRLPLDSLPWAAPEELPGLLTVDPHAERSVLPKQRELQSFVRPPIDAEQGVPVDELIARRAMATVGAENDIDWADELASAPESWRREYVGRGADAPRGEANGSEMLNRDERSRRPLPRYSDLRDHLPGHAIPASERHLDSRQVVRTALCVEPREGRLHIFMPPVETLEDYLELIAAIEQTAAELRQRVVIEGYHPPHDYRINTIKVTPDPGVIEVNIHPAESWSEVVDITTGVYEDARLTRLGAEKFMIDGRHTGSGGGNHLVLGGPRPWESPFLRRPDLLRSLVGYWLNHPSLSYLFSGLFIGPTSQAPRVDEGRRDALYELQLAFKEIPDQGPCPPWLVDRIFRNLLVDGTGNTHRAEFCIDKLFSPDSSSGRLGLVEFRGFEMPPHPQMCVVQQLLIRALVARFWEAPYRERLVDWDTMLHDRFMLPHFVAQDFADVIEETSRFGVPLDPQWFAPHLEFRFPLIGEMETQGIHLELRTAIEPWYVLGEEGAAGGTVRYVDSSVERLQVKVRGLTPSRYLLACNGRRVPLHPTGTKGEYVAGVRYRAWQPPACLHPTILVDAPLVFDLIDRWMERSVGGCTYHVAHPGGRNYTTFPLNAYEAESRRAARFFKMGHTPGQTPDLREEIACDFPLTLDLRRG